MRTPFQDSPLEDFEWLQACKKNPFHDSMLKKATWILLALLFRLIIYTGSNSEPSYQSEECLYLGEGLPPAYG